MRISKVFPLAIFVAGAGLVPGFAADDDDLRGVRRDLDAVRDSLKVIQNELETIKKMLQQPSGAAAAPAPFKEATITVDGAPFLGEKNAKVTLVEFSDYQCPFCARNFQQTFPQVMAEYVKTGKVKYVFRDFPLESIHPLAFKASEAARCSGEQGKYWEMHDTLFSNQTKLTPPDLEAHAKAVGVDAAKFKQCLDSGKQAAKIRADLADGRQAGVSGTPGFFVGLTQSSGPTFKAVKFISGAQPYANFKDAIEAVLASAK
jgi:protein-disulfide isomerase